MTRLTALALGALLGLGCGSSKSGQHDAAAQHDAGGQFDGNPGQHDANPQQDAAVVCGFEANLGTPTFVDTDVGTYTDTLDPTEYLFFDGYLNDATTPDVFEIELFNGMGVFVDGLKTGDFTLAGDELNYGTCGVCVRLMSKVDLNDSSWQTADQFYMATGGTVSLTSVTGRLTGTVSNVTFKHVDINWDTYMSTPLNDGCNPQIASGSFDGEIVAPDGGFLQYDGGTD